MRAITNCDKCSPKGKVRLTTHGTCDLPPVAGYKGGCALKIASRVIDEDVEPGEKPLKRGRK